MPPLRVAAELAKVRPTNASPRGQSRESVHETVRVSRVRHGSYRVSSATTTTMSSVGVIDADKGVCARKSTVVFSTACGPQN